MLLIGFPGEHSILISEGGGGWGSDGVAHPGHACGEGRVGEELVAGGVVDALAVLGEEFAAVEGDAADAAVAGGVHLGTDFVEGPSAFAGVEEVDAESGHDGVSVAVLEPVEEKGVVVVAREVHHGEEHVLEVLAEPELGVLPDGVVAVPSASAVATGVGIFPDG